jgi:2-C-methyl-D-erythritol 4-phosphate cytidylyltransferase
MTKHIALIIAGGIGARMHMAVPKQFVNINDRPVIIYTLEKFQTHPGIDAIYVSCLEGWENVLQAYATQFGISKLRRIVKGGATGQDSIHAVLLAAAADYDEDDVVLIHDANRPAVSHEIISDAIALEHEKGNAIVAIPCSEVVCEKDDADDDHAVDVIQRERLMRTQTPQVFPIGTLLEVHAEAEREELNCAATPELMCRLGRPVFFSKGSPINLKLTEPDDITLFKAILDSNER